MTLKINIINIVLAPQHLFSGSVPAKMAQELRHVKIPNKVLTLINQQINKCCYLFLVYELGFFLKILREKNISLCIQCLKL